MANAIGQFLTFLSYVVFWYSRFKKDKKNMLLYDNISRLFAIAAFAVLKTYAGIKNTIYVLVRNYIGNKVKNDSKKVKFMSFLILLVILFIMYFIDKIDISIIFIILCGVTNLYGVIMCDEQGIRLWGMIGSIFYTAFLFATSNVTGGICEIICFVVILISYIKYSKKAN